MDTPDVVAIAAMNHPEARSEAWRRLMIAVRCRRYNPDADQDSLVVALEKETDDAGAYYLWNVLLWSQPNEKLRDLCLRVLRERGADENAPPPAMGYLVNRFPDDAVAYVQSTPEEPENPYLQLERGKAWFLVDRARGMAIWEAMRATADHALNEVLDSVMRHYQTI